MANLFSIDKCKVTWIDNMKEDLENRNSNETDTRQMKVEAFCAVSLSARLMDENKEEKEEVRSNALKL